MCFSKVLTIKLQEFDVINAPQLWTPKVKINIIKNSQKACGRRDGQMDRHIIL